MKLTLAGEYAVRTIIYLASYSERELYQISEISEENNIPEKFLRKLIPELTNAGLIQSHRGSGGGIKLGKPASKITLLEIIQAVEGEMALNKCLVDKKFCSNESWCAVHTLWCEVQHNLKQSLSSKSIEQLVKENQKRKKRFYQ